MEGEEAYNELIWTGCLNVLFYVPHYKDSTFLPWKKCRYWPEVHHMDVVTGNWKQMVLVSPGWWRQTVTISCGKQQAYIYNVNLRHCFLYGLFDFTQGTTKTQKPHQINTTHWEALVRSAELHGIGKSDLNAIIPLQVRCFPTLKLSVVCIVSSLCLHS